MTYHIKCRSAACGWHLRAPDEDTADRVAGWHEDRSDHDVDVIPDAAVEYQRASERVDDPVGDDDHVEAT